jgi:hypothetical protein
LGPGHEGFDVERGGHFGGFAVLGGGVVLPEVFVSASSSINLCLRSYAKKDGVAHTHQ